MRHIFHISAIKEEIFLIFIILEYLLYNTFHELIRNLKIYSIEFSN